METEDFENKENGESSKIKEPAKNDGDSLDGGEFGSDLSPSADDGGKPKKLGFELPKTNGGKTNGGGRLRPFNSTPLP